MQVTTFFNEHWLGKGAINYRGCCVSSKPLRSSVPAWPAGRKPHRHCVVLSTIINHRPPLIYQDRILNIFISKVKHPENNINYWGCFLVVCWGWEVGNSVFPAIVTLGAKLRGKTAKFANMGNTIVKVIELCCV